MKMTLPYSGAMFCVALFLLCDLTTLVEMSPTAFDNNINTLYDALLQREYAGPIVFPNHQMERKAQRSPSLRLRFGRRSDPAMQAFMPLEKRWFGEVNQKAIRSPSLRLRFGRRSDPSMPLHTPMDDFLNNKYNKNNYDDNMPDEAYERLVRKPQRLRWGRSLRLTHNSNTNNNDLENLQHGTDVIDALLSSARVRNLLMNLRQYDDNAVEGHDFEDENDELREINNINDYDNDDDGNNNNTNALAYNDNNNIDTIKPNDDVEYQRDVKKSASPMRLRFGRSIGKPTKTITTTTADKTLIKTGMK